MVALTTNYSFSLPAVGADRDVWGAYNNGNWSALDVLLKTTNDAGAANAAAIAANTAAIATNAADIATKVSKAGDTMTGDLLLPAVDPPTLNSSARRQYVLDGELNLINRYTFNTGITIVDPGTGKLSLNGATTDVATKICISATKADGGALLLASLTTGYVVGISRALSNAFYRITSVIDHTTWFEITVTALPGTGFAITTGVGTLFTFIAPSYATPSAFTEYDLGVLVLGTAVTQAHGLTALPSNVQFFIKCAVTANAGYAIGDYVSVSGVFCNSGDGFAGSPAFSWGFNATNVFLSSNSRGTPNITDKTGSSALPASTLSSASWRVIARVWS